MTAAFFVPLQKPRPMHTLLLAHERQDRINGAQDASEIHDIIAKEKLDKFDALAAVMRLSRIGSVDSSKEWVRLHDVVKSLTANYGPYQASGLLHSYAKLARRGLAMSLVPLAELEDAVERVAPDMNSRQVSMTIWAYGTLGVQPSPQVIDELEAALRRVVTDMIPQDMSNIIWAYSKFGLRPMPETLDALEQVAGGLIRKMNPHQVATTLYSYAALPRTATDDTRDTAMSVVPLREL